MMHEVHEVAASGFGAQAATYDRVRPSYPPAAVRWLTTQLRIGPGQRVVDLAAGTGKFTALIAGAGADLVAVEPVAQMRDVLRGRLPGVPTLAGVAESLPFATGSLDAVTVAQAFHWFDPARAMAELARVVRIGGRVGLLWNARERGVDWLDRVWSVMDGVERRAPWRDEGRGRADPAGTRGAASDSPHWSERILTGSAGWSPWTTATFRHVQRATHQDLVDRILSVSHVAALPPRRQQAVLNEIRAILDKHPQTRDRAILPIAYRVSAMHAERLE